VLTDQTLSIVMLPAIISGVSFGGIANKLLPETIILVLLLILLVFFSIRLFIKVYSMYKEEQINQKVRPVEKSITQETLGGEL